MKKLEMNQMEMIEGGNSFTDCMARGAAELASSFLGILAVAAEGEAIFVAMAATCLISPKSV